MAARPISIKVVNNCGTTVKFDDAKAVNGTTPEVSSGSKKLHNGNHCKVYAQEKNISSGPEGFFKFKFEDGSDNEYGFYYKHPMGTGKTHVDVSHPYGYKDKSSDDHLQHHDASITVTLEVDS